MTNTDLVNGAEKNANNEPLCALQLVSGDFDVATVLDVGETWLYTCSYTVLQSDIDRGSIRNVATFWSKTEGGAPLGPVEDDAVVSIDGKPGLSIVKTVDPTVISDIVPDAGLPVKYTIVVTNTGDVTLDNVIVSDPMLMSDKSTCSPSLNPDPPLTLLVGEFMTYTCWYTVNQETDVDPAIANAPLGTTPQIVNTASVTATYPEGPVGPVTDDATIDILEPDTGIKVTKTADPTAVRAEGDEVVFTVVVENTGRGTLRNVQVVDSLDPACSLEPDAATQKLLLDSGLYRLPPPKTLTYTCTYVVTQDDVDNGRITNTATASGTTPRGDPVSDSDPAVVYVSDIELDKTADPLYVEAEGDTVTYTFTVTNTGQTTLTNVKVDDPMLADTCPELLVPNPSVTLQPGEVETFTCTYVATQEDIDNGSIENTATTEGTDPAGGKVNDEDDATVDVGRRPELTLDKSTETTEVDGSGDVIDYKFTVTNTGNVTLTNVIVDDRMLNDADATPPFSLCPALLVPVTLAPEESTEYTCSYVVTQDDIDSEEIYNTATATGDDPDGGPVSDDDDQTVPVIRTPKIELTKTSDRKKVGFEGAPIVYSFTVTNTGNVTLTNVTVDDPMLNKPTVTCQSLLDPVTLAPGASKDYTCTYSVTLADLDRGEIKNVATAKGTPPSGSDVTDKKDVKVIAVVTSLLVTKTANKELIDNAVGVSTTLVPGKTVAVDAEGQPIIVTYTILVENTGQGDLTDVVVTDQMIQESGSTCTPALPTAGAPASIATGGSRTYTCAYYVTLQDVNRGTIENTVTASADGNESKDDDKVVIEVEQDPGFTIEKTVDKPEIEGARLIPPGRVVYDTNGNPPVLVVYTIAVKNTGNVTLTNLRVDEPMRGCVLAPSGTIAAITPGETRIFRCTYEVTRANFLSRPSAEATYSAYTNTATATVDNLPPQSSTAEVRIKDKPAVSIQKFVDTPVITTVGQPVVLTFVVENTGNVPLTGVTVTDTSNKCPGLFPVGVFDANGRPVYLDEDGFPVDENGNPILLTSGFSVQTMGDPFTDTEPFAAGVSDGIANETGVLGYSVSATVPGVTPILSPQNLPTHTLPWTLPPSWKVIYVCECSVTAEDLANPAIFRKKAEVIGQHANDPTADPVDDEDDIAVDVVDPKKEPQRPQGEDEDGLPWVETIPGVSEMPLTGGDPSNGLAVALWLLTGGKVLAVASRARRRRRPVLESES